MLKQYITRFSRKSILHLKKPGHPSETIVTHPLTKYNSLFLIFIVFFTKEYESEKARKYRRKSCVLCAGRLFHFPLISFLFYFFIIIKGYFHWKFFEILMRKFHFEIIFPRDITIFFSAALFFAQQEEIWFEHFFLKWGYKYERDTADGNDKMDFGEEVGTIQSHFTQEKTLQPAYGWRRWTSSGACAPAPPTGRALTPLNQG